MFNKIKGIVEEGAANARIKITDSTDNIVNQFLAELKDLQPFLEKANIKFEGYKLFLSIPPRFEIISSPDMNWNILFNEKSFEGIKLSKYQEAIVGCIKQASKVSEFINSNGFEIKKVDFEISIPPSVIIEIKPK